MKTDRVRSVCLKGCDRGRKEENRLSKALHTLVFARQHLQLQETHNCVIVHVSVNLSSEWFHWAHVMAKAASEDAYDRSPHAMYDRLFSIDHANLGVTPILITFLGIWLIKLLHAPFPRPGIRRIQSKFKRILQTQSFIPTPILAAVTVMKLSRHHDAFVRIATSSAVSSLPVACEVV